MTELHITLGALGAGMAIAAYASWLERRPRRSINPRLIPTTPILFLGVLVAVLALVHAVNLAGLHTGR